MSKDVRKKIGFGPKNPWEATLEATEGASSTQAGEVDAGLEESLGGGDKGIDAETGDGGYGGDAVAAGHDEAAGQPDRPSDLEIHGDPRTPASENYPDDDLDADHDDGLDRESGV